MLLARRIGPSRYPQASGNDSCAATRSLRETQTEDRGPKTGRPSPVFRHSSAPFGCLRQAQTLSSSKGAHGRSLASGTFLTRLATGFFNTLVIPGPVEDFQKAGSSAHLVLGRATGGPSTEITAARS